MDISINDKTTPYVDDIYKERTKLKQKQIDIQNSIKDAIDNTDTQIRKLKNNITVLESKKKTLITEYNKECQVEDRIRGSTPPQSLTLSDKSKLTSGNKIMPMSSTAIMSTTSTSSNLETPKLKQLIEKLMEDKMSSYQHKKNDTISSTCNII